MKNITYKAGERNKDLIYKLIFFILWPFGAFLHSLTEINKKSSIIIFYLWFLVFGIGFTAANPNGDSYRYVKEFKMFYFQLDDITFIQNIEDYFTFNSDIKDIYFLCISKFVSGFTDNFHCLFFFVSVVFALFYLKSLNYVLKIPRINNVLVYYILLFIFCYSNPITNINGIRFWTASWIGVYFMFKIFVEDKKIYIPFILIPPLVHGSYFLYVFLIFLIFLLKKQMYILIPLFISSCFVSAVSFIDILQDYSSLLPQFMQGMIYSYIESDGAIDKMNGITENNVPSYAKFLMSLPTWFLFVLIILLIKERKKFDTQSHNILGLILVWSSFCNFTYSIPSVGIRFMQLVIPFVVYLWIYNYKNLITYNKFIYCGIFIYLYSIFRWTRDIESISDMSTYLTPLPHIINYNLL